MSEQEKPTADQPADVTQTPEFQAAVDRVVTAAVDAAVARALASMPAPSPAPGNELGAILSNLAMQISDLTNQGTGVKPVDPALIRSREEAHQEMWRLIHKARAEGKVASYRLKGKVFLGEELTEPTFVRHSDRTHQPTEVDWDVVPNTSMEPINDTAREIYAAFERSIAGTLRPVREQQGFFIKGNMIVKQGSQFGGVGATPDEMKAAMAIEQIASSGLRVHQRDVAGYETQQILGTTMAGRAMVTK
jgi:hypothetical protein